MILPGPDPVADEDFNRWLYGGPPLIAQDTFSDPADPLEGELQTWKERADPNAPLRPYQPDEDDLRIVQADTNLQLPHNWEPRWYQLPLWSFLINGGKRASEINHRRWGKDEVCLHWTACAAFMRVGNYWHMLPKSKQVRKAIWTAVNPHTGKRRIDEAFPEHIRKKTLDDEMFIEFTNGSTWQALGSDNFDSLVGSPPIGLVFSEWALANPTAWAILRPILLENNGWAVFIGTPRGHNHAEKTHKLAEKSEHWLCETSTADNTDVFTEESLAVEREELIAQYGEDLGEAMFQQEYFCSFNAAIPGAYFTREMLRAREEGRVGDHVRFNKNLPVHTWWDLGGGGYGDPTAIVFVQFDGPRVLVVDFFQSNGAGMPEFATELEKRAKENGYRYGAHVGPHDLSQHNVGTGETTIKLARDVGIKFQRAPKLSKTDSIQHIRRILEVCWFHETKCETLIAALEQHHAVYNEETKTFSLTPEHDWTSHPCFSYYNQVTMADGTTRSIGAVYRGHRVLLPGGGSGEVTFAGQTGIKDTIILEFDDGSEIECTPEHPFMSMSGLVPAIDLAYNDPVFSQETEICQIDQMVLARCGLRESLDWSLRGSRTGYGQVEASIVPKKVGNGGFFIECCGRLAEAFRLLAPKSWSPLTGTGTISGKETGGYGLEIRGGTPRHLRNTLSKFFLAENTTENRVTGTSTPSRLENTYTEKCGNTTTGTFRTGVTYSTLTETEAITASKIWNLLIALITPGNTLRRIGGSVAKIRRRTLRALGRKPPLRVAGKRPGTKNAPVFDLTIDKHHCFFVNGVLVSNCDAFKTGAQSPAHFFTRHERTRVQAHEAYQLPGSAGTGGGGAELGQWSM